MEHEKLQKYIYFRDQKGNMVTTRKPRAGQARVLREPLVDGGTYVFRNGHLELLDAPKPVELNLRPGVFYKSRDGRKVQVWAINKDSIDKPVLGMIQTGEVWETRYWNSQGKVKIPYGTGNDIITEWSEA